jgi:hypothetical protein
MPEGLFNSDEVRIHDLVVEGPKVEKQPFRIEDEIDEEELADWLEKCWIIIAKGTFNGYLSLAEVNMNSISNIKLLVPDACNKRIQEIDPNRTPSDIATASATGNLNNRLAEYERTDSWRPFFEVVFPSLNLSPLAVDTIRHSVLTDYRGPVVAYLTEKIEHAKSLDISGYMRALVGMKLLLPDEYAQAHGDEALRPHVKAEIESAYESGQWGKYRGIAAGAAVLFNDQPLPNNLDATAWSGMVRYLESAREQKPKDWTVVARFAAQMKLLASERIVINEEGVTIIDRQVKSDLGVPAPLPESRIF